MALTPGIRIASYEITEIGVGGMGEVYRATDTNLARKVAIKVLPDAVASDAERLARFDREAKTLAALNRPNIAHIYGLERSEGQIALVMELTDADGDGPGRPSPMRTLRKKKAPERVLALPDLEHARVAVVNSLSSANGRRSRFRAPSRPLARSSCCSTRASLATTRLPPGSVASCFRKLGAFPLI